MSGGMIDWIREAISVGFCQLKVKSGGTPVSGKGGVELQEGVGLAPVPSQALRPLFRRRLFFGSITMTTSPRRTAWCDQVGQRHALARLGGADEQGAAFEVLQRPVQCVVHGSTPWM